ncbi:hypothetical protein A9Q96_10145 [Rhodobacterales bacterium 52_120_T64]|nr:hypothetical protein A9Q96_10145 [Rhodobacterales bacterium 52_120_T64]
MRTRSGTKARQVHFRPHAQTGVLGFSQGMIDFGTQADRDETIAFPGSAGTFLMHHAKTRTPGGGK